MAKKIEEEIKTKIELTEEMSATGINDEAISAMEFLTKHNHDIPHSFIDRKYGSQKYVESYWGYILKIDKVI